MKRQKKDVKEKKEKSLNFENENKVGASLPNIYVKPSLQKH
jgi:hypothetical protein